MQTPDRPPNPHHTTLHRRGGLAGFARNLRRQREGRPGPRFSKDRPGPPSPKAAPTCCSTWRPSFCSSSCSARSPGLFSGYICRQPPCSNLSPTSPCLNPSAGPFPTASRSKTLAIALPPATCGLASTPPSNTPTAPPSSCSTACITLASMSPASSPLPPP